MTLGSQEVAPLTVAAGYATFAADGMYCEPISITSATTLAGKTINVPKQTCNQAIDENVARGVTVALEGVITHGTAAAVAEDRPPGGRQDRDRRTAPRRTWFTGYVAAARRRPSGSASPTGTRQRVHARTSTPASASYGGQIYGATVSAPIWTAFMKQRRARACRSRTSARPATRSSTASASPCPA